MDSVSEGQKLLSPLVADCELGKTGNNGTGGLSKGYGAVVEEQPAGLPDEIDRSKMLVPEDTSASRRFLLNCMCIPDSAVPPLTSHPDYEKYSTFLSGLLYSILALQAGFVILVIVHSSDWLTKERELFEVKIATLLSSGFFILLWLYWFLLYQWSRPLQPRRFGSGGSCSKSSQSSCSSVAYHRDVTPLAILWLLLTLYFVSVLIVLLHEVIEKLDVVFGSQHEERSGKENVEMTLIRMNFIIMIICFHVYLAVLFALMLEHITARKKKKSQYY